MTTVSTSAPPVARAQDPAAWTRDDVAREPVHQLDAEQAGQLAALGRSVPLEARVLAGLDLRERLPALEPVMRSVHRALAAGRGFALLRGFPVDRLDTEQCCVAYWGLGSWLGQGVTQSSAGELVGQVRDRGAERLLTRGYQSSAALTFHVDLADIVGLLCVRAAREGGMSLAASSLRVFELMRAAHPEYVEALAGGFHWSRNGEQVAGESAYSARIPLFTVVDGLLSCRMNLSMIRRGAAESGVPLTGLQEAALDFIQRTAAREDLCWAARLAPGDIQFLNNYTALHSRTEFVDWPEPERRRLMLRLWVRDPGLRPLGPQSDLIRDEPLVYGLQGRTPAELAGTAARVPQENTR